MVEPLTCHVYAPTSGSHLFRLPYTKASWSESYREPGSMSVDVDYSRTASKLNLYSELRSWHAIIALLRGQRVVHAGPLADFSWDAVNRKLSLTCGGGLTLLTKRLVLSRKLVSEWRDGTVLVDEKHPAGNMALTLTGSYRDIMRSLIEEAQQWGPIPISLPPIEGGTFTRTYYAWDLAKTSDRFQEIADLEDGLEYRFDPRIQSDGSIIWDFKAARELKRETPWQWNSTVPGQRVIFQGVAGKGDAMSSQVWATGGKDSDKTLMARRTSTRLTDAGWLFMQSTNTSHTTVSVLKTLQAYTLSDLAAGAYPDETFKLQVGEEYVPQVGDEADLRVEDDYMGSQVLPLKITDVDGSSDSDWLSLQARERS